MNRGPNRLIVALFSMVTLISASGVSAQIELRVVDSSGLPVRDVLVEFMGLGEIIVVGATSADGWVAAASERWSEVRRVTLRHIGYRTLVVPKSDIVPGGVLQLEPSAVRIEGLRVFQHADLCAASDEPDARRAWSQASVRYSEYTGRRGVEGWYRGDVGPARQTELLRVDELSLVDGHHGWVGGTWPQVPDRRALLEGLVTEHGYAWTPTRGRSGPRHLNWAYPELEGRQAYHFATAEFGARHTFSTVAEREGSVTLAFCPAERVVDLPRIQGVLDISREGWLLNAEWVFLTPEPMEDAGGEVVFQAFQEALSDKPHLVPAQGLFFRHNGRPSPFPDLPRDYYRELRLYTDWVFAPDGGRTSHRREGR